MGNVFRSIAEEVKLFLQLGDLQCDGISLSFFSKLHMENSFRELFVSLLRL